MPYIYDIEQLGVQCLHQLAVSQKYSEDTLGRNIVRKIREELLMSKAELARKAGVSSLTIDRIEKGKSCRMETKRKIILALGYDLTEKAKVFLES
jgi:DNA-binding XRE family transcriptional regulator